MATRFLKTREFGDCGEFRGIAERVCLDQCRNDLSQQFFPMSFEVEGGLWRGNTILFAEDKIVGTLVRDWLA